MNPQKTPREALIAKLATPHDYDLAIVGGGATGLGVALEAATRGLSVVLLESHDFAKGTSSRATKLIHGGVRYLAQGNFSLIRQALHERATLHHIAPHAVQPLPFVVPAYQFWEKPFYGAGLKLYDWLAGSAGFQHSEGLSPAQTLQCLPTLQTQGLQGGVKYWDGQFDDARLAISLARTAARHGALLVNYCAVTGLVHDAGKVTGLTCEDQETQTRYTVQARCVVNATGVWADTLRQQDGATDTTIALSQGVHLVVDADFLPGNHAMLIPRTSDGRVLFAIPWLGKVILGTTDTPRQDAPREPAPDAREIDFILREVAPYLQRAPTVADIQSQWVGLRPLVKPAGVGSNDTPRISREHRIALSPSGLLTVTGGKWTTYRAMAQDVLDLCAQTQQFPRLSPSISSQVKLVGATTSLPSYPPLSAPPGLHNYGDEREFIASLPGAANELGGGLSEAMVRFAVRFEYARTVEDVLARRSRLLFLDAKLAQSLAERVGRIVREETGTDPGVEAFCALAKRYEG